MLLWYKQLFHQSLIILLTFLLQLDIFQHLIFQTLDDCDCILIDKEKKVAFTEGKNDCHKYQYPRLLSGWLFFLHELLKELKKKKKITIKNINQTLFIIKLTVPSTWWQLRPKFWFVKLSLPKLNLHISKFSVFV